MTADTPPTPADTPPTPAADGPRPLPTQTPQQAERLRRIKEEQGVTGKSTFETLFGFGKDLWDSDEDFERFLERLRESRRRG